MAYKDFDALTDVSTQQDDSSTVLHIDGQTVALPDASYVRDAELSRQGTDLVLESPDGKVVVEGYFAAHPAPNLVAPDGAVLTPKLVNSFVQSEARFAANETMSDESPVGAVKEVSGTATVTHADGSVETIVIGTPIYQGDIIETKGNGAVNVVFIDETSFAVSEDARLAIDEYVFDASTQGGETHFSVLKGLFVFTSGLIGREDPDNVQIETPVGSIGIRGTIIAGNATTGEITVVEGAIVLHDLAGNEMTLANQFETARFDKDGGIENVGQLDANEVSAKFSTISNVAPSLFSSVNDAGNDGQNQGNDASGADVPPPPPSAPPAPTGSGFGGDGNSGFGGNNGGLGGSGGQNTAPPPPPSGGGQSGAPSGGGTPSGGGNPPPPSQGDGNPYVPPVIDRGLSPFSLRADAEIHGLYFGPPNHAVNAGNPDPTPSNFFAMAESTGWNYDFSREFADPDGTRAALTFQLSAATIQNLNTVIGNQGTYSFDSETGVLSFNFTALTDPTNHLHLNDIEIIATDAQGHSTSYSGYDFVVYNSVALTNTAGISTVNGSNGFWSGDGGPGTATTEINTVNINGDTNTIFLTGDVGMVRLVSGAENNLINLHNVTSETAITVNTGADYNTIFGSEHSNQFNLGTAKVEAYGMGGDDAFAMASGTFSQMITAGTGLVLDGGSGSDKLDLQFDAPGQQIDFRNMNGNIIANIEQISMFNNGDSATMTLNYDNVLNFTDEHNRLIIDMDDVGTLNLEDARFANLVESSEDFNDGMGNIYDVYTDGTITLLILQDGNASNVHVNGAVLPGM